MALNSFVEQANFPPKPIMRLKHLGELNEEEGTNYNNQDVYSSDDDEELKKKTEEETQKYVLGNVLDLFFKLGANDQRKTGERRTEKRPYPLDMVKLNVLLGRLYSATNCAQYTHCPEVVVRVNILLKNMNKQNVETGALKKINNANANVNANNTNVFNSSKSFVLDARGNATGSFDQIFYHQLKQLYKTKTVALLFQSIMTDKASVSHDEFHNIFLACDLYCTLLDRLPHLNVLVLNKLTFTNAQRFLTALWKWINNAAVLTQYLPVEFTKQLQKAGAKTIVPDQYKSPTVVPKEESRNWVQCNRIMTLFCASYSHLLIVRDDEEFFNVQRPLNLFDNVMLITAVKNFIFTLVAQKDPSAFTDEEYLLL